MGSVEEVSKLLAVWEVENSENVDPTATLIKLAEIFESETEAFLKKDPDPFDDRHPSRSQPDCTLGHMLKTVFKNENFVDQMVKVYCQRDCVDLNTAVCRLLLDILPGLENVIFQEEGFVPRLFNWAESAPNPLQSYATGLLAAAMEVQDIATSYREKNAYCVPLMLKRLSELSKQFLQPTTTNLVNSDRPFAHLNKESKTTFLQPTVSPNSHKASKKKKSVRYNPVCRPKKVEASVENESSNSNWPELEQYVIGCYEVYPLTLGAQQRYILQYLTPLGEYQDLIGHVFEANAVSLIVAYIDLPQNPDVRLAFEALKYLASLLCHKKIAIEFLGSGGLQCLLRVPRPSVAATGVSLCLYYLSYIEEAMERICLLSIDVKADVVRYALWLLECSHDSSRCHATMFFGFCFAFRDLLWHFDNQDGLRKLLNVMSTLDVFVLDNTRTLSDDQIFGNRQTTRHVCVALAKYFEAHLAIEVEKKGRHGYALSNHKCHASENVEQNIETLSGLQALPMLSWKPVDDFFNLDGVTFLLGLVSTYLELSYNLRADTVKLAVNILRICSLTVQTQLVFCDKISSSEHQNITGMSILLQVAEGDEFLNSEIQRSALHTIINCVCARMSPQVDRKKRLGRHSEELLNKLWKCVRTSNGIMVLIDLISIKKPLSDADSIRALACKALCGLARSETVKQIISKLPLVTNGQLLSLMREPVLQDKGQEHVKFCKHGLQLIERVTGAPVAAGTESSMLNINKAEVVAKTKVVYQETQLLQLIADHLQRKGFAETVACLHKEMQRLPPVTPLNGLRGAFKTGLARTPCSKPLPQTPVSIPPPSVPLKIVLTRRRASGQAKAARHRLQKPPTCSGGYVQSPAMRRQASLQSQPAGTSLDSIVTEYLRKQHALCKNPMLACPPFDLFTPHKCPEPHYKRNAPINSTLRLQKREMFFYDGGYGGAILTRKHIYSKFRRVRTFTDSDGISDFTYCSFYNYDSGQHPRILVGRLCGEVKVYNINTGEEELSHACHGIDIVHIESPKTAPLIITCDGSRRGIANLWNFTENFSLLHTFNEVLHMEFGKRSVDRMIGTKLESLTVFDTATHSEIVNFSTKDLGNNYLRNKATFDFDDELVLSDGLIYDVRNGKVIHKLDKFNARLNGVFHPNGREILSNTEIWDLRTFKLLRTVSSLDQTHVVFNTLGDVIYGVTADEDSKMIEDKSRSFFTVDAHDYSNIATINIKRPLFQLSTDAYDRYIGMIEKQISLTEREYIEPVMGIDCVCRLYQIGRTKGEGEEDGEDSEESDNESDEDDEADEDDNDISIDMRDDGGEGNDDSDDDFALFDSLNDASTDDDNDNNDSWASTDSDDDDTLFSLSRDQ